MKRDSEKSDSELGMGAKITRRDLIQDAGLAALGLSLGAQIPSAIASALDPAASPVVALTEYPAIYPPTRTGLRGSHPGAFETAHAIAREGKSFTKPQVLEENYDLVIVGAGISGLAAAHFYRQRFGQDSKILLLENHDDFGGHARRNEFHQGGQMRLSLGGTHNLEWWSFSNTVKAYLLRLGVDTQKMLEKKQFNYGHTAPNSPATWFDKETYGVDRLVGKFSLRDAEGLSPGLLDQLPLSERSLKELKQFFAARSNVLAEMDDAEAEAYLRSISYPAFLRNHGGLGEEALQLFNKLEHGSWGVEISALSAKECIESGLPGENLLGREPEASEFDYPAAMWPDGNSSLARLQVCSLIPKAAPGTTADNVSLSTVNYAALDLPDSSVRLRLNSTVVHAANRDGAVAVSYIKDGSHYQVSTCHCVMACYHAIIPHLCPDFPTAQKEAMKYQVKRPLILTNVLIRDTHALDKLGIDSVNCPGRMHSRLFTFRGINTGGYEHDLKDTGPVSVVFWGSISPPAGIDEVKAQHRASRAIMLELGFEDYEREVRTVLDGLLGPAGFDVENDILAITVNRWPHGYSYDYLDLWDEDWAPGEAPHEIARQTFGSIAVANSDAGADAYTHVAIDQAARAVKDLPGPKNN